ncbi:MAG: rRNA pseudouridine synthase [Nitrospirales bacterium]|nr:rRNA pseudouridine synthase [Nitrospirales bacterium]
MEQRLQKILAQMGIASRRKAEEIIEEGRVTVNGQVATLGMKADPEKDHVKLDGKLLTRMEAKVYLMLNKPMGVVTSLSDPEGRPTVKDYLRGVRQRVFPVGRLDYDSEGLLLITNDGDFAQAILHPARKVPKTYVVKAKGMVSDEALEKLKRGIRLEDGMTAPARVRKIREAENNSWVEITIHEGKKRQVRRMMEAIGHPVLRLKRVIINGLRLGDLMPGELRYLTPDEVETVRREAGPEEPRKGRGRTTRR